MKRILLVWGYSRIGWIEPFLKLKDTFEFIYLSYIYEEQDNVKDLDINRIYWNNYTNAQELLRKVAPDKIVFMDNYSSYPLVLSTVAKIKNIPTYSAQHGISSDFSDYLYIESIDTKKINLKQVNIHYNKRDSFKFLIKSLFPTHPILSFRVLKYLYDKRKSTNLAIHNNFDELLQTDYYIAFTEYNARIYFQRDNVLPNKTLCVGNYYCDDFFRMSEDNNVEDYYLLIDQPLLSRPDSKKDYGYTDTDIIQFYSKLNDFCKKKNSKLYIKLHPFGYNHSYVEKNNDGNIKFFKDTDVVALISNAKGCFGMMSTLMIPTLVIKNVCLFNFKHIPIKPQIIDSGIAQILDFENFKSEDILMEKYVKKYDSIQKIIDLYIFKADGKSIARLSDVLNA